MKISGIVAARNLVRLTAVGCIAVLVAGCGYMKNVRDDALDIGTVAVGVVTPVAPGEEENQGIGFIPPSLGLYLQATDFLQAGWINKATGDAEWDRRSLGLIGDVRKKIGLLFAHDIYIKQYPYVVNGYKDPDSEMDYWREHMDKLTPFYADISAKTLIYEPKDAEGVTMANFTKRKSLPYFHNGWQNWETFSVELALPEPFILHSGFYARVGVDPSEVFDFALGLLCLDLYDDNAYSLNGELQHKP
ncbi:MAG: hypothetical protein R6V56_09340 [Lentisphaeria bacterium]